MQTSRRQFNKSIAMGFAALAMSPLAVKSASSGKVRLGGPVFGDFQDPEEWALAHKQMGYGATYCPVRFEDSTEKKKAYADAAQRHGLVISEVGAWSNPISPDEKERNEALQKNMQALALADQIGANCCVNIAGSRGESWAGPHPENTSRETFDMVVETVRKIIDHVKPTRTFYTLETMPYTLPDSPDSYLDFIKAIDRKQFACHFDPVNMINSPRRYYDTAGFLRDCFKKLGPYIKNCHAKDIIILDELTVHLNEIRPGLGRLDYAVFLSELSKLPSNIGLMIEHLQTPEEYAQAAAHIQSVGRETGIEFA